MISLNDFIKLKKYNSLVYFDMGMSAVNYSYWSSFMIPEGSGEEDIELYTSMRIMGGKDLYRLFSFSVSECSVDNQKKIDGVVRFDFVPLCQTPADFVEVIKGLEEKRQENLRIEYYLGVDGEKEQNLFLADSFFESGLFSGTVLSIKSSEPSVLKKSSEFLSLTKKFGKSAKISLPPDALKNILPALEPGKTWIVNPKCDDEIIRIMRENALGAIFTADSEPFSVRKIFDGGVCVSFASGKYLLFGETLSDFAFKLFSSGLFSYEEIKQILGA